MDDPFDKLTDEVIESNRQIAEICAVLIEGMKELNAGFEELLKKL